MAALKNTELNDTFKITGAAGKFTFENLEKGASEPQVTAFDYKTDLKGTVTHTADGIDAASNLGIDDGR